MVLRLPARHGPAGAGLGHVLIADDDEPARRVLHGLVDGAADRVSEAADGQAALAAIAADPPDLVLLDLRMPGLDGYGVLARLPAATPVVLVTSADAAALDDPRLRRADAVVGRTRSARRRWRRRCAPPGPAAPGREVTAGMTAWTTLVVDDSDAKRYIVGAWLRRAGHTVVEAASAAETWERLAEHDVDLVVLDVKLPDMSGIEVSGRIKSDPDTASLPVIHISAQAVEVADRTHGLRRAPTPT